MRNIALGMAAAVATLSVPAEATVFTVTWEGTLDYGVYQASAGDPATDLTGRAFQVVYTIDDSLGIDGSSPPYQAYRYGGSAWAASSPVSAVFTIDGLGSYSILADYISQAYRINWNPGDVGYDSTLDYASDYHNDHGQDGNGNLLWNDYHHQYAQSQVYETDASTSGRLLNSTAFDEKPNQPFMTTDVQYHSFYDFDYYYDYTTGKYDRYSYLNAYSYSGSWVSPPSPTPLPEPASWALMITGFGLVGGAMRRRMPGMRLAA